MDYSAVIQSKLGLHLIYGADACNPSYNIGLTLINVILWRVLYCKRNSYIWPTFQIECNIILRHTEDLGLILNFSFTCNAMEA